MLIPRAIPILLLKGTGLVKGIGFKRHQYIGDPLNTIHIFNTKEVDELAVLDITATKEKRTISPMFVKKISAECLMPLMVGGGIASLVQASELLAAGAEKLVINSHWLTNSSLITDIAKQFGTQSVVVSIDAKKDWFGRYQSYTHNGHKRINKSPVALATLAEKMGAGEILITAMSHDGTMQGYDLNLIRSVSEAVSIPVIAAGGAGKLSHFRDALKLGGCAAVAASSFFIFHGPRRAVLISYPNRHELENTLCDFSAINPILKGQHAI